MIPEILYNKGNHCRFTKNVVLLKVCPQFLLLFIYVLAKSGGFLSFHKVQTFKKGDDCTALVCYIIQTAACMWK